jgi:hypothetical protein
MSDLYTGKCYNVVFAVTITIITEKVSNKLLKMLIHKNNSWG